MKQKRFWEQKKALWKRTEKAGQDPMTAVTKEADTEEEEAWEEPERQSEENQKAAKQEEIREEGQEEEQLRMSLPGLLLNACFLVLNGFVIAMILCLFLMQPRAGERIKPTIDRFTTNSDAYYEEGESYHQISDKVHAYRAAGRPD